MAHGVDFTSTPSDEELLPGRREKKQPTRLPGFSEGRK